MDRKFSFEAVDMVVMLTELLLDKTASTKTNARSEKNLLVSVDGNTKVLSYLFRQ